MTAHALSRWCRLSHLLLLSSPSLLLLAWLAGGFRDSATFVSFTLWLLLLVVGLTVRERVQPRAGVTVTG